MVQTATSSAFVTISSTILWSLFCFLILILMGTVLIKTKL